VHGDIKPCNILIGKSKSQIKLRPQQKQSDTNLNNASRLLLKSQNLFQLSGEQLLYLIDFGISTRFLDDEGKIVPQKVLRNIRCSPQYAGLNQLNGMSKNLSYLIL